jgi:hypothetical protein
VDRDAGRRSNTGNFTKKIPYNVLFRAGEQKENFLIWRRHCLIIFTVNNLIHISLVL